MLDFTYYNPVRAHFGRDALAALPEELAKYGKGVLLVTGGGSVRRTGLYDRIMAILTAAGKQVTELTGVMPNPRTEKVYEGIELCKKNAVDFILAVGGGSVIDCAKAVATGARTDRDFWEAFFKNWEAAESAIPLGVVLTMPATGSELDKSAVITNWSTGEKNCYDCELAFPQFSILDPTLTYTLPRSQTVNGVVDTLSHIMELYISPPDEPCVTDALAEGLMKTVIASAPVALAQPDNYDARANLMWASSFALCGMLNNGKKTDWASHNIQHPLSALFDVAHGAGLAVIHPAYLDYTRRLAPARFARFARNVWDVDAALPEDEQGKEGVARLRAFFRSLGAPGTLGELGVGEADFPRLIDLTDLSCCAYGTLTRQDVENILRSAL